LIESNRYERKVGDANNSSKSFVFEIIPLSDNSTYFVEPYFHDHLFGGIHHLVTNSDRIEWDLSGVLLNIPVNSSMKPVLFR
jgi:hypothetical protein